MDLQFPDLSQLDLSRLTEDEQIELYDGLVAVEATALSGDFRSYLREAWPTVEPSQFIDTWHVGAIGEHLQAVTDGEIHRLIINVPPRTGKSLEASVLWPTWEWTLQPSLREMFVSYSSGLSNKHSVDRRIVIESDWYQARWGDVFQLSSDQNVKTEFTNDAKGSMFATSIGGTATGYGGDRIVFDDPHNVKEVESDDVREGVITAYRRTFSTRLNDPKTGAIVVIMQRLHERDLTGYLLSEEPGLWTHLCLPMEYEPKHFAVYAKDPRKEEGELLCPERMGPAEVVTGKKALGTYGAAGQFQQRPSPAAGGIFKRDWWKYFDMPVGDEAIAAWLSGMDVVGVSWDMAFKDEKSSDYVAGLVGARKGADIYLLDLVCEQMGFSASCAAVVSLSMKWPAATSKWVEDKANGPAVIDYLRRLVPGLIPVEPRGSKLARAQAASPFVEAGNVHIRRDAPWAGDFVEETAGFPRVVHDDRTDAFTQLVDRLMNTNDGLAGWYEMRARRQEDEKRAAEEAKKKQAAEAAEDGNG